MSKIDIDKLVAFEYKRQLQFTPSNAKNYLLMAFDKALKEQGLCYKDGEIIEIESKPANSFQISKDLQESEDERIRKQLLGFLEELSKLGRHTNFDKWDTYDCAKWIVWLEKQGEQKASYTTLVETGDGGINALVTKELHTDGEQKPVDKVKPKFKVGDWVILTAGELSITLQIVKVDTNKKLYWFNDSSYLPIVDEECLHFWTIQDAKDGDVLYHKAENGIEYIVMNKGLNEHNNIDSYFRYSSINGFGIDIPSVLSAKFDSITPATKEQRDLLFQKMNEAGYEWDAEKKELKKIKQKPVWSEEDERMFNSCCAAVAAADYYTLDDKQDIEDWLKSLKQRIQKGENHGKKTNSTCV